MAANILSALLPFLLYPMQHLGSSQWRGNDRIFMTRWEAKDLGSFITDKSLPSRKVWMAVQFDFAGEKGTLSSLGTESGCLWPACFLSLGYVLEKSLSIVEVTYLRFGAPSGWGNVKVCEPAAVYVAGWVCLWVSDGKS